MSVIIANNVVSLGVRRRLSEATSALSKVSEHLSSGLRINKASDDAAGLQIAEGLKSDSKVYGQAIRNVNDGLSLLNIAQGAMQQLSNVVIRQAELAEQAANGVYSNKQRAAMNTEANALVEEYNRIIQTTSFNGINTLSGVTNTLRMQAGYGLTGGIDVGVGTKVGFAAGSGDFRAEALYTGGPGGGGIISPISGDFNGDGHLDLAAANIFGDEIDILLGNGDGTFLARRSLSNLTDGAQSVQAGDFNNDGILDLVASGTNVDSVSLFFGNGDGSFRNGQTLGTGDGPYGVLVADLNGDGNSDIVVTDNLENQISVLHGNGNGTFNARRSFVISAGGGQIRAADLNNDGILDLLTNTFNNAGVDVLLGNADGSFRAYRHYVTASATYGLDVGDLNDDGYIDLVSANGSGSVSVLLGNSDGSFRAKQDLATGAARDVALRDVNNDGKIDLVYAENVSNNISVALGNGNGTFLARTSFTATSAPTAVLLVDLNNDGILDITSSNNGGTAVGIMLGNADATGRRNNLMEGLDLTNKYGAKRALATLSAALSRIGAELGNLGAIQSRLTVAGANLLTARENFNSSASQITDSDVAEDSAKLIRTQILQQAASAVLAQANQQPQLALRLLGSGSN